MLHGAFRETKGSEIGTTEVNVHRRPPRVRNMQIPCWSLNWRLMAVPRLVPRASRRLVRRGSQNASLSLISFVAATQAYLGRGKVQSVVQGEHDDHSARLSARSASFSTSLWS